MTTKAEGDSGISKFGNFFEVGSPKPFLAGRYINKDWEVKGLHGPARNINTSHEGQRSALQKARHKAMAREAKNRTNSWVNSLDVSQDVGP